MGRGRHARAGGTGLSEPVFPRAHARGLVRDAGAALDVGNMPWVMKVMLVTWVNIIMAMLLNTGSARFILLLISLSWFSKTNCKEYNTFSKL